VHVHGAHYKGGREGEVFSASADFLSREMQQLSELRYAWSSVQLQRETLQTIYGCHSELVKSLASNPMRYSPVFHLEDFFDRYSDLGQFFDGAHISFADIVGEAGQENYAGHDLYAHRASNASVTSNSNESNTVGPSKRKQSSAASRKKHLDLKLSHRNGHPENSLMSPNAPMSATDDRSPHLSDQNLSMHQQQQQNILNSHSHPNNNSFPQHPVSSTNGNGNGNMPSLAHTPFSPPYAFSSLHQPQETYDPMFGMPQMGWATNAATPNVTGMTPNGMNGNGMSNGGGEVMTPGARSNGERSNGESVGTEGEKDPFLSLLEQLAENEHSRGGPSELDFFLSGGNG
jgi:hypothetical protein